MAVDTIKYLWFNLIFVKLFGCWSPTNGIKAKLYKIYSIFMYVFLVVSIPVLSVMYFVTKETIAVTEVADSAYMMSELTAYMFRMMFWLKKEKLIKQTVDTLKNPAFNGRKPDHDKLLLSAALKARRVYFVFLSCCILALFAWASVPLFAKKRILPLDVWYPFDTFKDDVVYVLVYMHVFAAVAGCTLVNVSTGTLVSGLMIHATGQLKILKNSLQQLGQFADSVCAADVKEADDIVYRKIISYVHHHEKIIRFVKNIESCFGMYTFAQFMAGSCIICTTAVELSIISPTNFKFYWMLSYMICMLIEMILFCWFGTELYYESIDLMDAIYASGWYGFGPKSKKALLILMERSKRPLRVRAAKLFDLSLGTYTKILRGAYSLFAVLQNLMSTNSSLQQEFNQ